VTPSTLLRSADAFASGVYLRNAGSTSPHFPLEPDRDKTLLKVQNRSAGPALISDSKRAASAPPLLKWPGGKRWLARFLAYSFPKNAKRYYEPFLGGAAVFFAYKPDRAVLSDSNADLVNCYLQIRDNPEAVLRALRKLGNSETEYYRVRSQNPSRPIERAARLLYLTTLSFNGIFRQNLNGEFNVPYGKKTHLDPAERTRIMAASRALQDSRIIWADFEKATASAKKGDLIYFDPPYTVAHGNNGFVKYNAKIFSWDDQIRLAGTAEKLSDRGCYVFISNADHPSIRSLYKRFQMEVLQRHSRIAATSSFRKAITECLFFNAEVIHGAAPKHSSQG
jgi:DNA adenine methylase